jgi:hypothetical protein
MGVDYRVEHLVVLKKRSAVSLLRCSSGYHLCLQVPARLCPSTAWIRTPRGVQDAHASLPVPLCEFLALPHPAPTATRRDPSASQTGFSGSLGPASLGPTLGPPLSLRLVLIVGEREGHWCGRPTRSGPAPADMDAKLPALHAAARDGNLVKVGCGSRCDVYVRNPALV